MDYVFKQSAQFLTGFVKSLYYNLSQLKLLFLIVHLIIVINNIQRSHSKS